MKRSSPLVLEFSFIYRSKTPNARIILSKCFSNVSGINRCPRFYANRKPIFRVVPTVTDNIPQLRTRSYSCAQPKRGLHFLRRILPPRHAARKSVPVSEQRARYAASILKSFPRIRRPKWIECIATSYIQNGISETIYEGNPMSRISHSSYAP